MRNQSADALKAYTLDSAYVLDLEKSIGSLEVGKLADVVVLEKDLYKIPRATSARQR